MGSTAAPSNTGGGYTGVRAALQYSTIQVVVIQVSGHHCSIVQSNTGGGHTGIWAALQHRPIQVVVTQV